VNKDAKIKYSEVLKVESKGKEKREERNEKIKCKGLKP